MATAVATDSRKQTVVSHAGLKEMSMGHTRIYRSTEFISGDHHATRVNTNMSIRGASSFETML